MEESKCKYKACVKNMFCFKNICIEKLASRLFKTIFIVMIVFLIWDITILTNDFSTHTISTSMYAYSVIADLISFAIGLGLFRVFLEIPVVLHKILNVLLENKSNCHNKE